VIDVQAPTGGKIGRYHFVVVTDPAKRSAIADHCRRMFFEEYLPRRPRTQESARTPSPGHRGTWPSIRGTGCGGGDTERWLGLPTFRGVPGDPVTEMTEGGRELQGVLFGVAEARVRQLVGGGGHG
jgi:hypothetical protein